MLMSAESTDGSPPYSLGSVWTEAGEGLFGPSFQHNNIHVYVFFLRSKYNVRFFIVSEMSFVGIIVHFRNNIFCIYLNIPIYMCPS